MACDDGAERRIKRGESGVVTGVRARRMLQAEGYSLVSVDQAFEV